MPKWKTGGQGGVYGEDQQYDAVSTIYDHRNVKHMVFIGEDGYLYHQAKGSKHPYPDGEITRISKDKVRGTPNLLLKSGQLRVDCPRATTRIKWWYINVMEIPDPSFPFVPGSSRLTIRDGNLYFLNGGTILFKGVGVSRRDALTYVTGQDGRTWNDCNAKYSLDWYQKEIEKYKLNYVRHDICNDTILCVEHADWARDNNIVLEYTLNDGDRALGNKEAIIVQLGDYPNIIWEVWNEMYSDEDVERAVQEAQGLAEAGLICSGGAIGAGGEEYADKFFAKNPPVDIIQVHRHWPYPDHEDNDWIHKYVNHVKPVGRNEFFNMRKHDLDIMKFIFEKSFEHGAQLVNDYGFRLPDLWEPCGKDKEGFEYWEILEFAQRLCAKLNPLT